MQIKSLLADAATQLNSDEAAIEAQILLQHILNVNRAWLIAHADDMLAPEQYVHFEKLLQRRLNGEPIAYILGYREFYSLKLKVTADTLIPRPDTETLAEAVLAKIPQSGNDGLRVLDLGTGSGAIALAIAKHRPHANVTAVEASENALKIAQKNAENLGISNVSFTLSDWFSNLQQQKFDVILSNPPYIEAADPHLNQGDLRFEPLSALASGIDGLDDIRSIIAEAQDYLNESGWLMLEHGYQQAPQVRQLLDAVGFGEIKTVQDLGGNDRVTFGRKG